MMELILIRHGKAQKRGSVFPDRKRKLVTKGINQLNQDIPYLNHHLKSRKKIYLWSSSILRAMETAEIIKNICGINEIVVQDFIGLGDFDGLSRKLKQMNEASTVIIVGHEPDLSEWTCKITKNNVAFKKGAAALIEIHPAEKLVGKIKWMAEPGDFQQVR